MKVGNCSCKQQAFSASLLSFFPELVLYVHIHFTLHPLLTQLASPSLTASVEPPRLCGVTLLSKNHLDCFSWPLRDFVVKEAFPIKGRKGNCMDLPPLQANDKLPAYVIRETASFSA